MSKLEEIKSILPAGYSVCTYSPGDGVTRYRFFQNAPENQSYFGPDNGVYTALAFKEAYAYARGLNG